MRSEGHSYLQRGNPCSTNYFFTESETSNDARLDCEVGLAQGNSRDAPGDSPVDMLHTADLEVLLDLLRNPGLVEKSRTLIEKAVVKGLLTDTNVSLRTSHFLKWQTPQPPPSSSNPNDEVWRTLNMRMLWGETSLLLPGMGAIADCTHLQTQHWVSLGGIGREGKG